MCTQKHVFYMIVGLWVGGFFGLPLMAQTERYVSLDGTNDVTGGYTTWEGAATTINAAITASANGDIINVSNGVYKGTGGRVVNITRSVTIRGVYGREQTIIDGENARCCVTNGIASAGDPVYLSGLTLRYGSANRGGGIYFNGVRAMYLNDCVIISNVASEHGGGIYKTSAASVILDLTNCLISANTAGGNGGGMEISKASLRAWNCVINKVHS